jgi:outer membrane biosynthesis protein TonB
MNSLRAFCIASSVILAGSFAFSEDNLLQGRGRAGGSSQGQGSRPPRNDNGQKPGNDNPPPREKPRDNPPPQERPRNDNPPPRDRPKNDPPPQERPRNDNPPPRERPKNDPPPQERPRNDNPPPRERPRNDNPPPRQETPRPRQDVEKPRGGDDLIRPRPGNGSGSSQGSSRPDVRPRPGDDRDKPGSGGSNQGPRPGDNKPSYDPPRTPREPIGRIDNQGGRPSTRPASDNLLGRKGGNTYGGQVSNVNRDGRNSRPIQIDRAPIDIFRGGLQHQVRREDSIRINRNWRSGYYHYRRDWCDDNFWFGFYVFDPFVSSNCYISPWYYYPHLPGYISSRCVRVINISLTPWYGTYYNWNRPYYGNDYRNYDYSPLDYAVDDITRAFENADQRALRRLIPYNERVAIFVDGEYSYSMEPDDFETFMLDAIEGTKTLRYEVTRVERRGREAMIQARHEYEDPWGRRTTVYHSYRLEQDRGNYVITRFGTSFSRNW